jgi:hypothetical protein
MLEKRLLKNTIRTITSDGDLLSNYLLALGKSETIDIIKNIFNDKNEGESEISIVNIQNGFSLLSVSKSECLQEINNSVTFFRGWFQDHDSQSIVLGQKGYNEWKNMNPESNKEHEGAYVQSQFKGLTLTIRNDLFSYLPVIYFSNRDLFVCSDSLYILSEVRKALGLPCKLNHKVMYSRAWTHGLACAAMSNDTQIEGVRLLSPGKHIEICMRKKIFSSEYCLDTKNIVKSANLKTLFSVEFDNYKDAIRDAATKMAQSTMSLLHLDDVIIKFGLSGGLDSRIILAAVLQKPELLEKITITTNTHPSRKGDFEVVEALSKEFNFKFNDDETIRLHRRKHSLKTVKLEDRFALWVLSSMGLFDMMYLHDSYWPKPYIIDMGGHGAETIKGTFAAKRFEDYSKPKNISNKKKASRRLFSSYRETKSANNTHFAIRNEICSSLESNGIDLDEFGSMQWHHLCYKSPIQNGRFLDRSTIAIRPFIQHSLYALAVSKINPFRNSNQRIWDLTQSGLKKPTLLHDMLIIINPKLATYQFENPKSNVSEEYVQSRLMELGGEIELKDFAPYSIHGSISEIQNGPPRVFLDKTKHHFIHEESDIESILSVLEKTWSEITDDGVRAAYKSAYNLAKERLSDRDFYPPSAGTPAAKIISLSLLD